MPAQAPDGDIYLSPVYLAGSTFTGDPALQPLLDQAFHLHLDELANVYVTSPEQHVRLGYPPPPRGRGLHPLEDRRPLRPVRPAPLARHLREHHAHGTRNRLHHRTGPRLRPGPRHLPLRQHRQGPRLPAARRYRLAHRERATPQRLRRARRPGGNEPCPRGAGSPGRAVRLPVPLERQRRTRRLRLTLARDVHHPHPLSSDLRHGGRPRRPHTGSPVRGRCTQTEPHRSPSDPHSPTSADSTRRPSRNGSPRPLHRPPRPPQFSSNARNCLWRERRSTHALRPPPMTSAIASTKDTNMEQTDPHMPPNDGPTETAGTGRWATDHDLTRRLRAATQSLLDCLPMVMEHGWAFSDSLQGGGKQACELDELHPSWAPLIESEALRLAADVAGLHTASMFASSMPRLIAEIDAQPLEVQQALVERAAERLGRANERLPAPRAFAAVSRSPNWRVPIDPATAVDASDRSSTQPPLSENARHQSR
ncbi:hypothetical protein SAMN05428943_1088 [Streptomyces sp. 2314.4]|nr:hypothetical protein SAMN05428943_1088 [Streptomyces sp. 2314.4]